MEPVTTIMCHIPFKTKKSDIEIVRLELLKLDYKGTVSHIARKGHLANTQVDMAVQGISVLGQGQMKGAFPSNTNFQMLFGNIHKEPFYSKSVGDKALLICCVRYGLSYVGT